MWIAFMSLVTQLLKFAVHPPDVDRLWFQAEVVGVYAETVVTAVRDFKWFRHNWRQWKISFTINT
jgi:hypothetical protein